MPVKIEIIQTAHSAEELEAKLIAVGKGVVSINSDIKKEGFTWPDVSIQISQTIDTDNPLNREAGSK